VEHVEGEKLAWLSGEEEAGSNDGCFDNSPRYFRGGVILWRRVTPVRPQGLGGIMAGRNTVPGSGVVGGRYASTSVVPLVSQMAVSTVGID